MAKGKGVSVRGPSVGVALFVVAAAFCTWVLWTTLQNDVSGETNTYSAVFTDATGLHEGDDVRIAGVKVGRVEGLELAAGKAVVEFAVSADQPVFANTRGVIRYQNLIGQRFLALRPGPGSATPLADGDRIPASRTDPSLDLTALLGGFEPLFDLLQPEEVNRLSESIIGVMQGEGPALRDLLEQSALLTTDLASKDEVIGRVITNLTEVMDDLAGRTDEFENLIARSKVLVKSFSGNADEMLDAVEGIDDTAVQLTGLVRDLRPALRTDLSKFNDVADVFLDDGEALDGTLKELPSFLGSFARITQYGSWLNIYACSIDLRLPGLPEGTVANLAGSKHTEVCR